MGKTIVIYKITPKDMEKLEETIEQIKGIKLGEVRDIKKEEIGFGITVVRTAVLIAEKDETVLEKLTAELNALSAVEEARVEAMTLL